MLENLCKINNRKIHSVLDEEFKSYGRVVTGYEVTPLIHYMEQKTEIPNQGNVYIASVEDMEKMDVCSELQNRVYGGMPIQIGFCNGKNSTYNGFEYHKGSEINIAVTDFMMVLGHSWDIKDHTYHVKDAEVFFVEKGTMIEMYQTTLHLSPCKVCDEGFKDIVVLPRGTNTPLCKKQVLQTEEDKLLLQKNKWVIAHPEREPLIKQGAFPGLLGENIELRY